MSMLMGEWVYRRIIEESPDGIILADPEGIIRLWNSGAESIFGYSAEEALGKSLDLIIPENLRERHWVGYQKVVATGVTRYGHELLAVPAAGKEGLRISIEFTIVPLRDSERGMILGVAAIVRDVTTRWKKERELKKRLADLENKMR